MAWLGTWAYRRKITIDNANIDSDLTHFPVPIVLGTSVGQSYQDVSDIFDEVGASYLKTAITKVDGATQIFGDVELWDNSTEDAVVHVAKSDLDITSAAATELYLYFDSAQADNTTYISASGGTAAQSVWDSNFKAVYHMSQDPSGGAGSVLDSTSNNYDGSPNGSMTAGDLIDGDIGKALDLDGTNDFISLPSGVCIVGTGDFTTEVNAKTLSTVRRFLISQRATGSANPMYQIEKQIDDTLNCLAYDGSTQQSVDSSATIHDNIYHRLTAVRSGNNVKLYIDGSLDGNDTEGSAVSLTAVDLYVGALTSGDYYWLGPIAEVRFSDVARSADWIKATEYALTDDLVTFNAVESFNAVLTAETGSYVITGTDVDLIDGSPKILTASPGSYAITGSDAALVYPRFITAESGAYTITGSDVQFDRIDADAGVYTITGSDVTFKIGAGTVAAPGTIVYLFTLTGAPDDTTDIEIPIESFQATMRSGDSTYLQIVIPGMDYATQINARPNGVLEVDLAYLVDGEYVQRETIIQANLADIRIYKGSTNKSISLTGRKQVTYSSKTITLDNSGYKYTDNGDIRYRFPAPNVYLHPGDTVVVGDDTFVANIVTYFVSVKSTTMEVAES